MNDSETQKGEAMSRSESENLTQDITQGRTIHRNNDQTPDVVLVRCALLVSSSLTFQRNNRRGGRKPKGT
jgi:hypothetical protein